MILTPKWFEHATFWSGVRRATVAPRSHMELEKDKTATIQAPNKKGGKATCEKLVPYFDTYLFSKWHWFIFKYVFKYVITMHLRGFPFMVNIYPFFGGSCQWRHSPVLLHPISNYQWDVFCGSSISFYCHKKVDMTEQNSATVRPPSNAWIWSKKINVQTIFTGFRR